MGIFRGPEVQAITGLPAALVPMAIVPVGWPASPLGPPTRIPVEEKAHRERFGNAW
jgi:hypothetical protein